MTSRREWRSTLGSWQWKAPPASARASAVRAAGSRRGLGRSLLQGSTSFPGRWPGDTGVFGEARVGLCCRRAHADSDDFGRPGRRSRALDQTRRSRVPRPFGEWGRRGTRNGRSGEVLTFVQCARPFVWLQKSGSDARSRQASPVAAGGAHGGLAQGSKSAKNGSRGRNGVERMSLVATPGKSEGPAQGSLLAEGVRCRGNGRLSRGGSGSGIGQESGPNFSVGKPDWRHGRHRLDPALRTSGANTVGPAPGKSAEARPLP
jgi:hypothetical protein